MENCSKHKKEVAGISDMKVLAEMIGDLHYESLSELFGYLYDKIMNDALRDKNDGKTLLSDILIISGDAIGEAQSYLNKAWQISKPFMNQDKTT